MIAAEETEILPDIDRQKTFLKSCFARPGIQKSPPAREVENVRLPARSAHR